MKLKVYRTISNYFPELIKITRGEYRRDLKSYIIYYEKIVILTKYTIVHNECSRQISENDHFYFDNLSKEKELFGINFLERPYLLRGR